MKLRLVVQRGSLTGRQYELEQGWMLLGRGPDCVLRFDPLTEAVADVDGLLTKC